VVALGNKPIHTDDREEEGGARGGRIARASECLGDSACVDEKEGVKRKKRL